MRQERHQARFSGGASYVRCSRFVSEVVVNVGQSRTTPSSWSVPSVIPGSGSYRDRLGHDHHETQRAGDRSPCGPCGHCTHPWVASMLQARRGAPRTRRPSRSWRLPSRQHERGDPGAGRWPHWLTDVMPARRRRPQYSVRGVNRRLVYAGEVRAVRRILRLEISTPTRCAQGVSGSARAYIRADPPGLHQRGMFHYGWAARPQGASRQAVTVNRMR
jgi:hypothetical protein